MRLASWCPTWLPALQVACVCAKRAEQYDGESAGAWVLAEMEKLTGERWLPGLRTLATYGLFEKSGESVRGGRRAHYRMLDRQGVEMVVAELKRRKLVRDPARGEGAAR